MHTNFIYTHMLLSVIASITVHQCIGKSQRCKWSCICASMHVYMCACMYNVTHARWALPSLSSLLPLLPLLTTLSSLAINPSVSPATYTTLYSQPASQPLHCAMHRVSALPFAVSVPLDSSNAFICERSHSLLLFYVHFYRPYTCTYVQVNMCTLHSQKTTTFQQHSLRQFIWPLT